METKEIIRTRGGAFLLQETYAKNVFTPEDFSEEQQMMRDAVKGIYRSGSLAQQASF
jgi:hypothetical protein